MIFDSSMADNNATDTTKDGQRKHVQSDNGMRSPSLMGVYEKRKRGRSATKHKKAKNSYKTKHSKSKRRYRSTSSSWSTEKSSPSPERHKSRRKKCKHRKRSPSSLSPSSSSESSETIIIKGRWVANSKQYLRKKSSDTASPMTWPNMPIHSLKFI